MSGTEVEYKFASSAPAHTSHYVWQAVDAEIRELGLPPGTSVFDLGCGNGALAAHLTDQGFSVSGVDPSASGIALANEAHPSLRLETGTCYEDLGGRFGTFPLVVSLEVVEHVYDPRHFARTLFDLFEPGGTALVSTPYHGYLKNLALAASGKLDTHFTALWDGGHIKFFSIRTLGILLREAGFEPVQFKRVGRIPPLAKSMLAIARRPGK